MSKQIKDFPQKTTKDGFDKLLIQDGVDNAYKQLLVKDLLKDISSSGNLFKSLDSASNIYNAAPQDNLLVTSAYTINFPQDVNKGDSITILCFSSPTSIYSVLINDGLNNKIFLTSPSITTFTFLDSTFGWIYPKPSAVTYSGAKTYVASSFVLSGNASKKDNYISLTIAAISQYGKIEFAPNVAIEGLSAFNWLIKYRIYGGNNADGIFIYLKSESSNFYIQLDTYQNSGDIAAEHIKVASNNKVYQDIATSTRTDSAGAYLWIDYSNNNLKIYRNVSMSKPINPIINVNVDIASLFAQSPVLSVEGATGGAYDNHDLFSFSWNNTDLINY